MKKKFLPLTLLFPLLTTACGATDYSGKYVFQLGKEKETHIGIYLELTNQLYSETEPAKGNKYTLDIDMTTGDADPSSIMALINDFTIDGYYSIREKRHIKGDVVLSIGIDVLGNVEIPPGLTEYIFAATINNKQVNFIMPVSIDDLNYQLYWYGFDITLEKLQEAMTSGEEIDIEVITDHYSHMHAVGSHPTQADVELINQTYPATHDGKEFRDYHTIAMGLLKQ